MEDEIPGYIQPELIEAIESDLSDFDSNQYLCSTEVDEGPRIDPEAIEVSLFGD